MINAISGKTTNNSVTVGAGASRPAGHSRPGVVELLSGKWIDILNPEVNDIYLPDIAGGLAKICRFQGQTNGFCSVAEHSVLCAVLAREQGLDIELQRAALLHDAHEAYLGDIPTPIKALIPGIEEISERLDRVVGEKFSIDPSLFASPEVKDIDHTALSLEAYEFMSLTTPGFKEALKPVDQHPVVIADSELNFNWPLRGAVEQAEALFTAAARRLQLSNE